MFTLELQPHTSVGLLKILLESRCGIPIKLQKLYYGQPRRELFGRESEILSKVIDFKQQQEEGIQTITIEIKGGNHGGSGGVASSTESGGVGSSSSFSSSSSSSQWGAGLTAELNRSDDNDDCVDGDDLDNFVAWLEHDPSSGGDCLTSGTILPSPTSTTIANGDDADAEMEEIDPFADGADDGDTGDWGDENEDDGFDDDDTDEMTTAKQENESKFEASNTTMQSSAQNTKLGVYECLTLPTLLAMQKRSLSQLDELIGCTMNESAILMRHYRWNKDRLFTAWLDNPEQVQVKCGLMRMKHRMDGLTIAGPSSSSGSYGDCPLCGDPMTTRTSLDLGCTIDGTHRFCLECWKNWAMAEMDKGPQAIRTTCCSYKCNEIIPDDIFLSLLDTKKRKLLSKWFIRNYVDSNPHLRWCVNSRCSRVLRYTQGGSRDVECECGTRMCFACQHPESHSPCQCELVKQWSAKNNSEKDNTDWILANTKPCPGCKTNTEKNSGCNHMTCKHCKHEYCWLCLGEWQKHSSASGGYYACNIYERAKEKSGASMQDQIMADAQAKYQFHWERFMEYEKSILSAVKLISQTETKMETLLNITCGDLKSTEYLLHANKTVIECRRALKWSYVIAFYLKPESRQLHMFQLDQGQLEKFSDELHGLIELPVEHLLPTLAAASVAAAAAASSSTSPAHKARLTTTPSPKAATPTTPTQTTPAAASSSSSSSTVPALPPVHRPTGDELRKLIQSKTAIANKFLVNLTDAVTSGQYIDVELMRVSTERM